MLKSNASKRRKNLYIFLCILLVVCLSSSSTALAKDTAAAADADAASTDQTNDTTTKTNKHKKKHHKHHDKDNEDTNASPVEDDADVAPAPAAAADEEETPAEEEETPEEEQTPAEEQTPPTEEEEEGYISTCTPINTCAECTSNAQILSTSSSSTVSCYWGKAEDSETESCFEIDIQGLPLSEQSFTCDSGEVYEATTNVSFDKIMEGEDGGGGGNVMSGVFVLVVMVGALVVRQKVLERQGSGEGGFVDDLSTIMTTTTSGRSTLRGGNSRFAQETVPLSAATDEEWGWEDGMDSTGDVELSNPSSTSNKNEEDDLQMALALSLSEKNPKPPASSSSSVQSKTRMSKGKKKSTVVPSSSSSVPTNNVEDKEVGLSSEGKRTPTRPMVDEWDEPIPSPDMNVVPDNSNDIEALLESTRPSHVPKSSYITSFSKKTPTPAPARKKEEKKKAKEDEDDIFASMGLSNFPSSTTNKPKSTPPSSGSGWGGGTSAVRKAAAATAAAPQITAAATPSAPRPSLHDASDDLAEDEGSTWDDDSDLDDLLDD